MSNFIQEQNQERDDYRHVAKFERKVTFWSIFWNKISRSLIFLVIFATACPLLIFYFVIDKGTYSTSDYHSCLVEKIYRVPCGVVNVSSLQCLNIHCCYDQSTKTCYHYLPSKYSYDYDETTNSYTAALNTTPYGNSSITQLQVSIQEINENQLSIIVHEDSITVAQTASVQNKTYNVTMSTDALMVEIKRIGGNEDLLLTTSRGPLIASSNYWEWSFMLTDDILLGIGQNLIKLDENSTLTKVIYKNQNDHSTLPVFWAYKNGMFHGVVIKHDGPMELTVLPSNLVILRSLTGEKIELQLSVGPSAQDLHNQQMGEFILPPYWLLGTHICRKSDSSDLYPILQEYSQSNEGLAYDSECIHENLLIAISKNITDENMDDFKELLGTFVDAGTKLLLSIPPHIYANSTNPLYSAAQSHDVLYKNRSVLYHGKYLDIDTVYPDFSHPSINQYIEELNQFIDDYIGVGNITGFVLDDNWPVDNSYRMIKNSSGFQYLSDNLRNAMSLTLPWYLNMSDGVTKHMKYHNSYGSSQNSTIYNFYKEKHPDLLIMSASKVFGESQADLVENINATWDNLRSNLGKVLFNSISGNHLVSIPVCGDNSNYNKSLHETLCIRWYLMAATMPIFRMNSQQPFRNPQNLNTVFADNVTTRAIATRKTLQAYYYTILSRKEPVVRPMFYDYLEGNNTFTLERQYMIGKNILIAHPFSSGRTKLEIFLPQKVGIWYEFWGGQLYNSTVNNMTNLDIVETDWISFIAQGSIIPLMEEQVINLIVALNCTSAPCKADGELLQEESYMNFAANETTVTVSNIPTVNCNFTLGSIRIYYYENETSLTNRSTKNQNLCDSSQNYIEVHYENETNEEEEEEPNDQE